MVIGKSFHRNRVFAIAFPEPDLKAADPPFPSGEGFAKPRFPNDAVVAELVDALP
jgi:hypothetical protein